MSHTVFRSAMAHPPQASVFLTMKLFALLLLVLTAIAAAVPAPLNVTAADGPLLDITVDVDSIATGGEPKAQPGFWPFDITFHETYNGGSSLIVTADFWWVGGSTKFNFINSEQMVWVRVNSRDLQIFYDFKYHGERLDTIHKEQVLTNQMLDSCSTPTSVSHSYPV
jgi:hypothetical protein